MIYISKKYFEIKLFNYLKNNKFINNFTNIRYLNEFYEIYKRIEIQRLIINYKLAKLKKDIYFDSVKYMMIINNKYLFYLVKKKNYYVDKMFNKKSLYLNLCK